MQLEGAGMQVFFVLFFFYSTMSRGSFEIGAKVDKVHFYNSSQSLERKWQMANIGLRFYIHNVSKVFLKKDDEIANTAGEIYRATEESEMRLWAVCRCLRQT